MDETPVVPLAVPDGTSEYDVTAVETIHRVYSVRASNPEQARQRLRRFFADPDVFAPNIVSPQGDGDRVRWQIRGEKKPKPKG